MGLKTLRVPVTLFAENRAKLVQRMQEAANGSPLGVALLAGGKQTSRFDTDHEETFRQESYFAYLFGVQEAGFYGCIDLTTGRTTLFMPKLPAEYATWMGRIKRTDEFRERYGVDEVRYVEELPQALAGAPVLHLLHGVNTDSGEKSIPASFAGIESLPTETERLHPVLSECRVVKSAAEVAVMRYAARISSQAHVSVMQTAQLGMAEYQLESNFLHYVYYHGGCRFVSYTCICATGKNAATLHYGHSGAPNDRVFEDGDMALLDMGAEYSFYGSDITRSFPIGGRFSDAHRTVYNAVLAAQDAVMGEMRPGVEWVDMHRLAERTILSHLHTGGLLRGSVDDMCKAHLGAVFMPHGLGHLLGVDTHDVGGYPAGRERILEPGIRSLRMNRPLLEGMVVTVEPGCYFVDHLINAALADPVQSQFLVPEVLQRFRSFGGVRIEDDILITADGIENLTLCPRTVEEVEAVMAGKQWPSSQPGNLADATPAGGVANGVH